MKRKGFTLIELLAVIIILGILMLIAIPSVTSYINNSRKETYVDTIKETIKGASSLVNSGDLDIYDPNTTYYIPVSAIDLENGNPSSPYGKINDAYVVVTYDGDEYDYYYVGKDEKDMGISILTSIEKIDKDKIEEVDSINTNTGIDDREKIIVYNQDLSVNEDKEATEVFHNGDIIFPEGKTKKTLEVGDQVIIGTEEFKVMKIEDNDVFIFARYNLNVGSKTYSGSPIGIQSSEVRGRDYVNNYGVVSFASTNYWESFLGEYKEETNNNYKMVNGDYPYAYNSDSNLYRYLEYYKKYLESYGIKIKSTRLLTYAEGHSISNDIIGGTTYWLGSAGATWGIWVRDYGNGYGCGGYTDGYGGGVRPVIVI